MNACVADTPDDYLHYFPDSSGLIGKGPFREVQVILDGILAGVVWPFAVIYTGGITPSNWRPLASYGAYDQPSYYVGRFLKSHGVHVAN